MADQDPNPVLDLEVVESLKGLDEGQGSSLFLELIDLFVEDAATQIVQLRAALESGDTQQLERAAHTLKSSAANIGALQMSDLCFELEKLGRAGCMQQAPDLVERTGEAYRQVCEALEEVRG